MDENTTEISLYPLNCFEFEYPDFEGKNSGITVRVIYWATKSEDIIAEAWLRNKELPALNFLGDVVEIENFGLSADEVEDKIIQLLNNSEVFNDSVTAARLKSIEYFSFDSTNTNEKGD